MDPNLIGVLVTPENIKQGAFLLGRYKAETKDLTDLKVVNNRGHVPPNTDLTEYKLIGMGDTVAGQPLDEFVEEKCHGWDGVTPITIYFNRTSGNFVRWEPAKAATGAAAP